MATLVKYWVGPKVPLDFSIRSYGKSQTNLLANPMFSLPPLPADSFRRLKWYLDHLVCLAHRHGSLGHSLQMGTTIALSALLWLWSHPEVGALVSPTAGHGQIWMLHPGLGPASQAPTANFQSPVPGDPCMCDWTK